MIIKEVFLDVLVKGTIGSHPMERLHEGVGGLTA